MRRAIRLPFVAACLLALTTAVFATTYHFVTFTGKLSDFAADERFPDDPWTDSLYGPNNELHGVAVTWDKDKLYLGFDYKAWNTGMIFLLDTGKSGGVSNLCKPTYKGAFPANVQGPAWDMMITVWVYGSATSGSLLSVHRLDNNTSTDISLFGGVKRFQKETANTTATNPYWGGVAEVHLSWQTIYKLAAGKVPPGARIKLAGVLRGTKDNDGLGDAVPNPKAPNSTNKLTKNPCGSGSGLGNKVDRFFEFVVDCDNDGVPDKNRRPNVLACPTMPKKDGGVPDQKVVKPDQTVVKPDQMVVKPDQTGVKPDQTGVKPDQKVVKKDTGSTVKKDTGGSGQNDQSTLPDDLGWADMPLGDGTGKADAGIIADNTGCACAVTDPLHQAPSAVLLALTLVGLALIRRRR